MFWSLFFCGFWGFDVAKLLASFYWGFGVMQDDIWICHCLDIFFLRVKMLASCFFLRWCEFLGPFRRFFFCKVTTFGCAEFVEILVKHFEVWPFLTYFMLSMSIRKPWLIGHSHHSLDFYHITVLKDGDLEKVSLPRVREFGYPCWWNTSFDLI